jgi:hypothetical protein
MEKNNSSLAKNMDIFGDISIPEYLKQKVLRAIPHWHAFTSKNGSSPVYIPLNV